jgi:hypothetical protein
MLNFTKKSYLVTSGILLASLSLVNLFALGSFYEQAFLNINQYFFEPILVWSLALFACSVVLLFFSKEVFNKWIKYVLAWFLPVGLLLTFLADPTMSYVLPNRFGFAVMFGSLLVAVTFVFALVQKFRYKV